MATIISLEHTEVKIGGLTIRGFSSDADSLTLPDIEGVTVDRNALGTMMGMTTGNKGGPVTIKLQASAPELKELYGWVGETINGTPRIFPGFRPQRPLQVCLQLGQRVADHVACWHHDGRGFGQLVHVRL